MAGARRLSDWLESRTAVGLPMWTSRPSPLRDPTGFGSNAML